MLRPCSMLFCRIKCRIYLPSVRNLYGVRRESGAFYVDLPNNDRAALLYHQTGRLLDMYSVKVPKRYTGQGVGRLLAEAAFTYVIVNDYRMYLTCPYLQRYYETVKTEDLSTYVVGPEDILDGDKPSWMSPMVEADKLEGMPDPSDSDNQFNK